MRKHRYFIDSNILGGKVKVSPVWDYTIKTEKEDKQVFYRKKISGVTFVEKQDYDAILLHKDSECAEISIYIEEKKDGIWTEFWEGIFTIFDCDINYELCTIKTKVNTNDDYNCILKKGKATGNIESAPVMVSSAISGHYAQQSCTRSNTSASWTLLIQWLNQPYGQCLADESVWCIKTDRVYVNGVLVKKDDDPYSFPSPFTLSQTTTWHMNDVNTPCLNGIPQQPEYNSGWQLWVNNCQGNGTAKWVRCPSTGGYIVGPYWGRWLEDALNVLLSPCNLTAHSVFFEWGYQDPQDYPVNSAYVNSAYSYAHDKLRKLSITQKSDVKRKTASQSATGEAWDIILNELLEDMRLMFNIGWIVEDGKFIIEHISYFDSGYGLKVLEKISNKSITYDGNGNIKEERFNWAEESQQLFKSKPIIYPCGEETRTERTKIITTDLQFIENKDNKDKASDSNFVIISNFAYTQNGTLIYVIDDANSPLSWENLQAQLFGWGRLYKEGQLNGIPEQFESWFPYKQQPITAVGCFKAEGLDRIKTPLGVGHIEIIEENIMTNTTKLKLKY